MQRFDPEYRWECGMKKEGANAVVQGAQDSFGLAVLLGRIRTREAKEDAIVGVEFAEDSVVELASVVSLERPDGPRELCADEGMKRHDFLGDVRLMAKGECPYKMREVIEKHKVVLKPSKTGYR